MAKSTWIARLAALAILGAGTTLSLSAAETPGSQPLLDKGYRQMYNLDFANAHTTFAEYERLKPADAMGPVSDAAAYLFSEFDRLGILRSDFLTKDDSFFVVNKPTGDPSLKKKFDADVDRAHAVADAALKKSPDDPDAMLASSLELGLRANYLALIERKNIVALTDVKQSRVLAQKLLAVHPDVYDANIAEGIENYLLSQKNMAIRWFLRLGGAETSHDLGIQKTTITAEKGHYFKPYAELLLAIADLRDNKRLDAKQKLTLLAAEYPGNHLYRDELERLVIAK